MPRRRPATFSRIAELALAGLPIGVIAAGLALPAQAAEFRAGGYAFSDELGGFRLIGASGSGTARDPVVLIEEFDEAAPATLVIRRVKPKLGGGRIVLLTLTLDKVVTNLSERIWAGFEVELQENLRQPSVYGDGLSFNQFGAQPPDVASDSFQDNNRRFEPYDRILFQNGQVNPGAAARFRMTLTDPTPVAVFFLVQDPKLLSASRKAGFRFAERRP